MTLPRRADEPPPKNLTISLEAELWAHIEAYQGCLRTKTTTEAVRRLLWLALEAEGLAKRDAQAARERTFLQRLCATIEASGEGPTK